MKRGGNDIVRSVQEVDPAILEFRKDLRLEYQVPGIHGSVGHPLLDLCFVEANRRGSPHVVDRIRIVWIVGRGALRYLRPHIGEVWKLRFVELLENAGIDLAREERSGRHNDVVARVACEKLGLENFVAVE